MGIKIGLIFGKTIGKELAWILPMILLVTASDRGTECGQAIEGGCGETTVLANTLLRASTLLRERSFLAVVLDQHLLEHEPLEVDAVLQHLDSAILVQVNFALNGKDRAVREVRSALERGRQAEAASRRVAISKLYGEVNGTITALLLTVELALESPALPPGTTEKLQSVHILTKKLRSQLESAPTEEFVTAGNSRF